MAVKIAPSMRQQFEDANGNPYVGGKLFTYAAGSSTKQSTFTDSTGLTANTNPIILDSAGRTPFGVWLTAGLNYKFVLALSTDTDPPSSPIFTEDVVSGVNDTTSGISQWQASGSTPTYINATQFTVSGDKTADFHVGRRLKFTVTAGTVYGIITVTAYTTLTTVTVVMDSGSLDSGLSAVELGVLTATSPAIPKLSSANLSAIGIQPLDGATTSLAGLALAEGDTLYATAADTLQRLAKGTARQRLRMNAAATAPEWAATTYVSAEQTITAAGTLTIAHGLGVAPVVVSAYLVCQTGEHGYSAGDKLLMNGATSNSTTTDRGHSIVFDATNFVVRFSDAIACYSIIHKTTGVLVATTNANWKLVIAAVA